VMSLTASSTQGHDVDVVAAGHLHVSVASVVEMMETPAVAPRATCAPEELKSPLDRRTTSILLPSET